MVTADRQIHKKPPIALGLKILPAQAARTETKKYRKFDCCEITMRPNLGKCNAFFGAALQQFVAAQIGAFWGRTSPLHSAII